MEVCIAFTAGYREAGDRHEVCCNVVHVVGRLVVGVFVVGVVTGLNEGWSPGTISGSISRKFEGERRFIMFCEG